MTAERALVAALFLALGIVAYQEVKSGNVPPRSYRFVGVALGYTLLGVLAIPAAPLAAAFGFAFDVWLYFATNATVQQNQGVKGFPVTGAGVGGVTGQVPQPNGASVVAV